jgi:hypothetical protein
MKAPSYGFHFTDDELRKHYNVLIAEHGAELLTREQLLQALQGTEFDEHAWWCPVPPNGTKVRLTGVTGEVRREIPGNRVRVLTDGPNAHLIDANLEDFEVI